jgi:beta-N-acetylhexosaminidase
MLARFTSLNLILIGVSLAVAGLAVALLLHSCGSQRRSGVISIARGSLTAQAARGGSAVHEKASRSAPAHQQKRSLAAGAPPKRDEVTGVSLPRMVGQQLMVRMDGADPDAGLLSRIRQGEVGGVILYAENIESPSQTRSLVAQLQDAAREGGNPPLLISTDQEGGQVKRLPWAPPDLAPPQMGAQGSSVSENQGKQTGAALRSAGINVDLAPVVDVAHSASSFIWQEDRSFGMSAGTVIDSAVPFAEGMQLSGVAPTAKHFPGVGGATTDTDNALQTIPSEPEDRLPYQALIADHIPLIMVSTAVYPNLDPTAPAALSRPIITGLLRGRLSYQGTVITDDLERPTGYATANAAIHAANAGADIILVSSTEEAGATVYQAMLAAAERGTIPLAAIEVAYQRIQQLKVRYAEHSAPA